MSLRSPKHKFSATITFDNFIKGIGQTTTVTANSIEEVEALAKGYNLPMHVSISENKAEYPAFDWVKVKEYNQ